MKELLQKPEYDFLRTEPALNGRILFLTYGGSIAYGTNNANSDTDIRGVCYNRVEDMLHFNEMHTFEQHIDRATDTVVYSLSKALRLFADCNPSSIEMLGCKPEHYYGMTEDGQLLLDNKRIFLSQRASKSFTGYARQQLDKLENALARDRLGQSKKEKHILNACLSTIDGFEKRYSTSVMHKFKLILKDSKREDLEKETFISVVLDEVPLREFASMASDLANVAKCYDKLNHRNHKKDDEHINKHAMHLVRLYLMGIEILETGKITTYREKDLPLLLPIRQGYYMKPDGTYEDGFFDLVKDLENKMTYAIAHTCLPVSPDRDAIFDIASTINRKTIVNNL